MAGGFGAGPRFVASATLGIFAAVAGVEVGLRPFATPEGPPTPRVALDSINGDTLMRRQLDEGVSIARFSKGGARLTGNPFLPNRPVIALLGDSYVVAEAVSDEDTMGAVLERKARSAGFAVNVRQYGWFGATPSRYLLVADSVLRRWDPADVVVAVSDNDLDADALYEAIPQVRVMSRTDLRIMPFTDPAAARPRYSTLSMLLERRTWELQFRRARAAGASTRPAAQVAQRVQEPLLRVPSDSAQLDMMPAAVVHALAAKFGERLAIIYLADVHVGGDDSTSAIEGRLLAACGDEHVRCVSTRRAMLDARRRGVIARGFFNTTPASGHLNVAGHEIVGTEIWHLLSRQRVGLAAATRQ